MAQDIVATSEQDTEMENVEAPFKFIDLFAGIGGLRRGFDAIGGEWGLD